MATRNPAPHEVHDDLRCAHCGCSSEDGEFTDDLDESVGYAEFDWDRLPEEEIALHDEILDMEEGELDALDLNALTDLQLWAVAQAAAEFERDDQFAEIARKLVTGSCAHPALDYAMICMELMSDYLVEERFDDARQLMPRLTKLCTDEPILPRRFSAIIDIEEGFTDRGFAALQTLLDEHPDDADVHIAIAEDLIGSGIIDRGIELLEKAEEIAMNDNDQELLEIIRESRGHAEQARALFGGRPT